jgi:hypothetical protein
MDTDQIYQHARARFEHAAARRTLKEKYESKMIFAHAGGMWKATPEMISLLGMYSDDNIVILDLYETPTSVNANELRELMRQRWQEQMTAWLVEYQEISRQR